MNDSFLLEQVRVALESNEQQLEILRHDHEKLKNICNYLKEKQEQTLEKLLLQKLDDYEESFSSVISNDLSDVSDISEISVSTVESIGLYKMLELSGCVSNPQEYLQLINEYQRNFPGSMNKADYEIYKDITEYLQQKSDS
jgi:cysteinyl-tRNA synthetase